MLAAQLSGRRIGLDYGSAAAARRSPQLPTLYLALNAVLVSNATVRHLAWVVLGRRCDRGRIVPHAGASGRQSRFAGARPPAHSREGLFRRRG